MDVASAFQPEPRPVRRLRPRQPGALSGVTLVEMMVAIAVLAISVVGLMSGFTLLNGYAARSRLAASAKALCQERIEQVITQPFHPPARLTTVDAVSLLGTAANWTAATAPYTENSPFAFQAGAGALQTSQDVVNVCVQQDGVTNSVTGTRTTTVSVPDAANSPDLALFTVTLTYSYRGQPFSTTMSTLRAVD